MLACMSFMGDDPLCACFDAPQLRAHALVSILCTGINERGPLLCEKLQLNRDLEVECRAVLGAGEGVCDSRYC